MSKNTSNTFSSQQGFLAQFIIIVVLIAGVGVGGYLMTRPTNLTSKASVSRELKTKQDKNVANPSVALNSESKSQVKAIPGSTIPTLSLSPRIGKVNKGCDYQIQVLVNTANFSVSAVDVILNYDPSKITVNSIDKGQMFPDYPGNRIDAKNGKVRISGIADPNKPVLGNDKFATINISIPKTAPLGKTKLSFDFDPINPQKTNDSNFVEAGVTKEALAKVSENYYMIGNGICK